MEECMRINNTKRSLILLLVLMLWITASAALAEHTTPRVYHAPRTGKAPFMEVPEAAVSPLAEGQDTLDVYFINIGIGDAMMLSCGGETMLIDGGTYSRYPRLTAFLESKEIRSFDYIFVTHGHDDHVQGPDRLLAKGGYDAGEVLVLHEREYRNASHQIFMETVEKLRAKNNSSLNEKHTPFHMHCIHIKNLIVKQTLIEVRLNLMISYLVYLA